MKKILTMGLALFMSLSMTAQQLPYQNPKLSSAERAKDLLSRLTLNEKALLMLDESPAIPRLGIKKFFWWSEALHGAANMGNVTVFPEPIGMAASFNNQLLYNAYYYLVYLLPFQIANLQRLKWLRNFLNMELRYFYKLSPG